MAGYGANGGDDSTMSGMAVSNQELIQQLVADSGLNITFPGVTQKRIYFMPKVSADKNRNYYQRTTCLSKILIQIAFFVFVSDSGWDIKNSGLNTQKYDFFEDVGLNEAKIISKQMKDS